MAESKSKPPGVARQLVTFLVLPRKVTKRSRPRFAAAARFPALLDWSGGCGTRATRSDSPRRNPLTSLRYSAALRGMKPKTANLDGGQQVALQQLNYYVDSGDIPVLFAINSTIRPCVLLLSNLKTIALLKTWSE